MSPTGWKGSEVGTEIRVTKSWLCSCMKLEEGEEQLIWFWWEKGTPPQSLEFKVGKWETLVHYSHRNIYVSISTVPIIAMICCIISAGKLVIFVYSCETLYSSIKDVSPLCYRRRFHLLFYIRKTENVFLQLQFQVCSHIFSMPNRHVNVLWIIMELPVSFF